MKAINILWCIDDEDINNVSLPYEITIPDGITDEDEIGDYISDITGFCHEGFVLDYKED